MKERPVLFNAPMVNAILSGQKTQTRRVVKPPKGGTVIGLGGPSIAMVSLGVIDDCEQITTVVCPYGKPGDRLWVRENFQPLFADGIEYGETNWKTGKGYSVSYPATNGIQEFIDPDDNITSACKPSIHMPRWASRINLEITGVRVERLNDISESDAEAEGVVRMSMTQGCGLYRDYRNPITGYIRPDDSFASLWESINGSGSWAANPWVWVIEFRGAKP